MGRIRNDYEASLIRGFAEEVVDLFGVDDAILYRFAAVDQTSVTDPLWGEPSTVAKFKEFPIKVRFIDPTTEMETTEQGGHQVWNKRVYIAINHLIRAGVPQDASNDYVAEGDVIAIHTKTGEPDYTLDVIQVERVDWINDSDKFAGYELEVARRDKYHPERKTNP